MPTEAWQEALRGLKKQIEDEKARRLYASARKWTPAEQAKFSVRAEGATGPVEISIHGFIGDSWWDESATSEHQFLNALKDISPTRELVVSINSEGGSVKDGLGIYNAIKRWQGPTTARITGFAVSIASIIPLAADKVISPRASNWMIHDPHCMTVGNAADHQKTTEMLESCAATMASIYSDATGKSRAEMRDAMRKETWFTGEEAVAFGLASETNDEPVALNLGPASAEAFKEFRNVPQRIVAMLQTKTPVASGQPKPQDMNKEIIALLAKHGKQLPDNATNEAILAALSELVASGKITQADADKAKTIETPVLISPSEWNDMRAKLKVERDLRITQQFRAIAMDRPFLVESEWLPQCLANESMLKALEALPAAAAGIAPIPAGGAKNLGNDIIETYRKMKPGRARLDYALENWHGLEEAHESQRIQALSSLSVQEQLRRLNSPKAANTYSASLVTDRLADQVITTIGINLAPLRAFSTEFGTDRLKPRATVQVPKATAGSTTQTNPTNFETGDSTTVNVPVSVSQINQGFNVTNDELNKGHTLMRVAKKNAQNFSFAINDILTSLMTVANYGASFGIGGPTLFNPAVLSGIWALAKNYPTRNLVLDGSHLAYLIPTDKFKFRLGEADAYSFDLIVMNNRWTGAAGTSGTVAGFICDPSAIAVASGLPANLPSADFIELGTAQIEQLGLTFQLAHWFSRAGRVHWMSYDVMIGAAAGDTTAAEILHY